MDDEELVLDSVVMAMERLGHQVSGAADMTAALEHLQDDRFDLVITDIRMPESKTAGMEVLKAVKARCSDTEVIMMTGYGSIENAVEAIRLGAFDYVEKGSGLLVPTLELRVKKALEQQSRRQRLSVLEEQNRELKSALNTKYGFENIIGRSGKMRELFDQMRLAANSKATVFISGPSGTGKELVAKALHYNSPRRDKPFIKINCAAVPEGLIESELFGHEKGAFTGAIRTTKGKFELANGGTLLLDEISEMNPLLQAKLLRVLQEREFEKIGDSRTIHIDVRIVATTNRDIKKAIDEGRFREDLFYRLNVVPIKLPSLSERREDIPLLAEYFILKYSKEHGREITGITEEAMEFLQNQEWHGNVRELENSIERAIVMCVDNQLIKKHFPQGTQDSSNGVKKMFNFDGQDIPTIAEMEREVILRALEANSNNRTRAAEALGISIRTLRNKLNEYRAMGIDIP